ncbi:MAG: hypothetical protein IPK61_10480 [Saprospiraceae bacterium]|nr:hypothetical protein [Saprospiraceae bacterium]
MISPSSILIGARCTTTKTSDAIIMTACISQSTNGIKKVDALSFINKRRRKNKISYFFWVCSSMVFNSCCYNCESPCSQSLSAYEIAFFCYVFDKETNESIVGNCLDCPYSDKVSTLVDMYGDTIRTEGTITAGGGMRFSLIKQRSRQRKLSYPSRVLSAPRLL